SRRHLVDAAKTDARAGEGLAARRRQQEARGRVPTPASLDAHRLGGVAYRIARHPVREAPAGSVVIDRGIAHELREPPTQVGHAVARQIAQAATCGAGGMRARRLGALLLPAEQGRAWLGSESAVTGSAARGRRIAPRIVVALPAP